MVQGRAHGRRPGRIEGQAISRVADERRPQASGADRLDRREAPKRGWHRPIDETLSDHRCALRRTLTRCVDLNVVDTRDVNVPLPTLDWTRDGLGLRCDGVLTLSSDLTGVAPLHDHVDRTADSNE